MDKNTKITRIDPEPPLTEGMLRTLFEKYGVKSLDDLEERLDIYQALADHDYTAIDKGAYNAIMEDLKELKEKARLWDILLPAIAKSIGFGLMLSKVTLGSPKQAIELSTDDFIFVKKSISNYLKERRKRKQ